MNNTYIRYGDEIRIESVSTAELTELANFIIKNDSYTKDSKISFFSWDNIYIYNYGTENLSKIYKIFH